MVDFREEFCMRNVRLGVVVRFLENILHTCQVWTHDHEYSMSYHC